jgi:solute carrier family 25 carnitine/acylcarnitine transporter 20/29
MTTDLTARLIRRRIPQVLLQTQPAKNPIYSGPLDAVKKVVQAEGVGGLYKGVTSPLAGQMFFRATLFFGRVGRV